MMPGFDDLLELVRADKDLKDLFGGETPMLRQLKARRELQGQARRRYAEAVMRVSRTADGKLLFEAMINMHFGRFDNVTGLGLPMETAIQLHAFSDGGKDVVWQLLKLIAEAEKGPNQEN